MRLVKLKKDVDFPKAGQFDAERAAKAVYFRRTAVLGHF